MAFLDDDCARFGPMHSSFRLCNLMGFLLWLRRINAKRSEVFETTDKNKFY